ncbi:MAG: helix-turn-helix domain-containing protein [Thermoproteota archaeon]
MRDLKELGLSLYEGKAYFSCLVLGKAKAWELARYSAVPQSRVYYVLERLEEKGLVKIEEGRPKYVKAIPVKELAYRMVEHRKKQIEDIKKARRELEEIIEKLSLLIGKYNNKRLRFFELRYSRFI